MPASIIFNQPTTPAGVAGKARNDSVVGQVVTCTNATVETSYFWTLLDVPIRSALVRGATGTSASFTFTPDVKGTYLVSLRVNNSSLTADNATSFVAVLSADLGWRYLAAGEERVDNTTKTGLGFPSNVNTRGWATDRDLQLEETEEAIVDINNAVITSPGVGDDRLVRIDGATGQIDPTLIPGGASGVASVSALTPLNSSGGTNPVLTLNNGSTAGDVLTWNGSAWAAAPAAGGVSTVTATAPLLSSGGSTPDISLDTTTATEGDLLTFTSGAWVAQQPAPSGVSGVTATYPLVSTGGSLPDIYLDTDAPEGSTPVLTGGVWTLAVPAASDVDHFAPKFVVGNELNGDLAPTASTNGFKYYKDAGDGVALQQALSDASAAGGGTVYLRPGTYTVSSTLNVGTNVALVGEGYATYIVSTAATINGPLISLSNRSVLKRLRLEHNDPAAIGAFQFGVVDFRVDGVDSSALCEDVSVLTRTTLGTPETTLCAGFYVSNPSGFNDIALRCLRCSVAFGNSNGGTNYVNNLVGYRTSSASLYLTDCTAQYRDSANGYPVIGYASSVSDTTIEIVGGYYNGLYGVVYCTGTSPANLRLTGVKLLGQGNGTGVGALGSWNTQITNCHIYQVGGSCVYFDAQGSPSSNTGTVVGNRLLNGGGANAWNSISDGYHVIANNVYKGNVITSTNDEVAHNILLP